MKQVKLKLKSTYFAVKTDAEGIGEPVDSGFISCSGQKDEYIKRALAAPSVPLRITLGNVGVLPNQYLVIQFEGTYPTGCVAFETENEMLEFFEY